MQAVIDIVQDEFLRVEGLLQVWQVRITQLILSFNCELYFVDAFLVLSGKSIPEAFPALLMLSLVLTFREQSFQPVRLAD